MGTWTGMVTPQAHNPSMKSVALLLLAAASVASFADQVDDLARRAVASGTPGVSIAIIKDGKFERIKGYGFADVENRVKVTPESMFQIGSVTKQFTATVIMMLVEQQRVVLEAPVSTYLPELPEGWRDATIRQLLNHTSGIPNYTDDPAFWGQMRQQSSDKALIELASKRPNGYKHGEKWSYNNTAYYLLGMVIEKITGKTYDQVLRERVWGTVGMPATKVNSWTTVLPNRARGYTGRGKELRNADFLDLGWPGAGGFITSNAKDLSQWLLAQESTKLLKSSSWDEMIRKGVPTGEGDRYGFGWILNKVNGVEIVEHGGGIPGFGSYVLRLPGKKFAVAVLTNSDDANPKGLAYRIAEHFHPDLKPKVSEIIDPKPEVSKRLRAIFEGALQAKLSESDFGSPLKERLFPANTGRIQQMFGEGAKLVRFTLIEANEQGGGLFRKYQVEVGDNRYKVTYQLASDGKIIGWLIQND